jgi:hypothetical protein
MVLIDHAIAGQFPITDSHALTKVQAVLMQTINSLNFPFTMPRSMSG